VSVTSTPQTTATATQTLALTATATATSGTVLHDVFADAVLGQPDLNSGGGSCVAPSSTSLCGPRAVAADPNGRLFVADTGNHRVLSWPSATSFSNGEAADVVFGQADFTSGSSGLSATQLSSPGGVAATGGGQLYVADSGNHRILRFTPPFSNGMAADRVFGQSDFDSGQCNRSSQVGAAPDATTLCAPAQLVFKFSALYVADQGNHRVLQYVPNFSNGKAASLVLGQADFTSGQCNRSSQVGAAPAANTLCSPAAVAVDLNGVLSVADQDNHRALQYQPSLSNGMDASLVVGQSSFTSGQCNQSANPSAPPTDSTLCSPRGIAITGAGALFVADTGNNRTLRYGPGLSSGLAASKRYGQADFTSGACNRGGGLGVNGDRKLCSPMGLWFKQGVLHLADTANQRLLRFN
jgi:sugar lactone lactonase YvrE